MLDSKHGSAGLKVAIPALIAAIAAAAISPAIPRAVFTSNLRKAVARIDSLGPIPPKGIGPDRWNECVNATITEIVSLCTYNKDSQNHEEIICEILALGSPAPDTAKAHICKTWEIVCRRCEPDRINYIKTVYGHIKIVCEIDCLSCPTGSDSAAP